MIFMKEISGLPPRWFLSGAIFRKKVQSSSQISTSRLKPTQFWQQHRKITYFHSPLPPKPISWTQIFVDRFANNVRILSGIFHLWEKIFRCIVVDKLTMCTHDMVYIIDEAFNISIILRKRDSQTLSANWHIFGGATRRKKLKPHKKKKTHREKNNK